jgi:hypothetical protein
MQALARPSLTQPHHCWHCPYCLPHLQDGTPLRGVNLECMAKSTDPALDANIWLLQGPTAPYQSTVPPEIVALDCHPVRVVDSELHTLHQLA